MEQYDYITNPRGHVWRLNTDGSIDEFGYEWEDPESWGGHNGPICIKCGYSFCHHCRDNADHDCPVNE